MKKLDIRNLAKLSGGEFVSFYLPTNRSATNNKEDLIRFKNLLTEADKLLKEKCGLKDSKDFLEGAEELYDNPEFWKNAPNGLAVLVNNDETKVIKLEGKTPEKVVVSDKFHLLPLLNYYEFLNETYILDISRDRFNLYYGDHEGIREVETPNIKNNFKELFDDKDIQQDTHRSGGGMISYKTKSEIDSVETEKYLRYVAKELGSFLQDKKIPVLVFGTVEVVSDFKEYAKGDINITKVIDKPLEAMNPKELNKELKEILLPKYEKQIANLIDNLNLEISRDKGTDNASRAMEEAKNGRIDTLFITKDGGGLKTDDVDELLRNVLISDGDVVVVDENITEFPMGVGAIYRY
ncbi:MAG: hypothetical protein Q4P29_07930 [Tissierellia bacterium]|nr:hypothetical protein [Tissierellia bacterium]